MNDEQTLPDRETLENQIASKLACNDLLHGWLCERVDATFDLLGGRENVPRWWRICWLVARNGGFDVHGWGFLSSGGLFGSGLEQDAALELMQHNAFFAGVQMFGPDDPYDVLHPVFEEFIRVHEEIAGRCPKAV